MGEASIEELGGGGVVLGDCMKMWIYLGLIDLFWYLLLFLYMCLFRFLVYGLFGVFILFLVEN